MCENMSMINMYLAKPQTYGIFIVTDRVQSRHVQITYWHSTACTCFNMTSIPEMLVKTKTTALCTVSSTAWVLWMRLCFLHLCARFICTCDPHKKNHLT